MSKIKICVTILLSVLALVGCVSEVSTPSSSPVTPKQEATDKFTSPEKWDNIVALAKQEAKLMVYASGGPELREPFAKAFKQKYGIEVEFVVGRSAELLSRILRERERGLFITDIVIPGTGPIVTSFKPAGIVEPIPPILILPEVLDAKAWLYGKPLFWDEGGYALGLTVLHDSMLLRNTDLVKEGQIKSLKDLLKPEWKGKIVMYDPTTGGGGNQTVATWVYGVWGMDETKDYLRQLVKQEITITRDPRQNIEWVARGKFPLATGNWIDLVNAFLVEGAPIHPVKVVEPGFLTSGAGSLARMKDAPHPNAAIVLINWLLSREGQTIVSKSIGATSLRVDVPSDHVHPSLRPVAGEKVYIENDEGIKGRALVQDVAREIMAPLLK